MGMDRWFDGTHILDPPQEMIELWKAGRLLWRRLKM